MIITPPPRTILCATDLSGRCDRALDRAVSLARRWNAKCSLLTVVDPADSAMVRQRHPTASRRLVAESMLRAEANMTGVEVSVRVEEGAVADTILRVGAEESCDLIVTGIARSEAFGRMVLGSTVDTLLRDSGIPVLVVRSRVRGKYRRVTIPTDFLGPSRHALESALAYFPDRAFSLFHAYGHRSLDETAGDPTLTQVRGRVSAEREARRFLDSCGLAHEIRKKLRLVLSYGSPCAALHDYVENRESDLIVLATHAPPGGGVAKRILDEAMTDVLVVRGGC